MTPLNGITNLIIGQLVTAAEGTGEDGSSTAIAYFAEDGNQVRVEACCA